VLRGGLFGPNEVERVVELVNGLGVQVAIVLVERAETAERGETLAGAEQTSAGKVEFAGWGHLGGSYRVVSMDTPYPINLEAQELFSK
jgi:hypothetical protein